MEFEKTLFKVHEKLLTSHNSPKVIKLCTISFFAFFAVSFLMFFSADMIYRGKKGIIGTDFLNYMDTCYKGQHPRADYIYRFAICEHNTQQVAKDHQEHRKKQKVDKCGRVIKPPTDGESTKESNEDGKKFLRFLEHKETLDGEFPKQADGESTDGKTVPNKDGEGNNNKDPQVPPFDLLKYCGGSYKLYLEMSSHNSILNFPKDYKQHYNFMYLNTIMSPDDYSSNFVSRFFVEKVYSYEDIVINDIINSFNYQDLYIKNMNTTEMWHFPKEATNGQRYNFIVRMIIIALELIKITFGLFLTSAITAIYLKVTIICAPIFILLVISIVNQFGSTQISRATLYRAFPWMGIYLYSLDMQQSKIKYLVRSFVLLILLFYCVYLSSIIFISSISFFYKSMPKGLDENFFGFQACLEFGVLLFLRTRSAIKWFPKTTMLLIYSFLIYVQQTIYGFYYLAFYSLFFGVFAFFGIILFYFEMPAMTWNSSFTFTPSSERPRTLYFPLFSMNWFYDMPQLWTMFYPLHGRQFFNDAQLSLVDRNYVLLNQTLNRPPQHQQQQQQQQHQPQPNQNIENNQDNNNNQQQPQQVEMSNIQNINQNGNQSNSDNPLQEMQRGEVNQDSLQNVPPSQRFALE